MFYLYIYNFLQICIHIPALSWPVEVPKDIISAAKNIAATKSNIEDELEIVFWDFAGQDIYYTTHQVSIESFRGHFHFMGYPGISAFWCLCLYSCFLVYCWINLCDDLCVWLSWLLYNYVCWICQINMNEWMNEWMNEIWANLGRSQQWSYIKSHGGTSPPQYKRPHVDVLPTWVAKSASWYMNDRLTKCKRTSSDFNENQPKHQNRNFLKTLCKHLWWNLYTTFI